jgi:S-adenosylmethionine:tRNA ribosyltransferase-isomerase
MTPRFVPRWLIGTTVTRALESAAAFGGRVEPADGWTDLVLGPDPR